MSDTSSRELAPAILKPPEISASVVPKPAVFDELNQIAKTIKTADRSWDVSQQAALAITTMAQQSAAIGNLLDRVVGGTNAAEAAAIHVAGRIASGNVTIDNLGEEAMAALSESLSRSGTAWWAEADTRIGKLGQSFAGVQRLATDIDRHLSDLTSDVRHIGDVLGEELSCLCGQAKVIARNLCGTEYDALYAEVRRTDAREPRSPHAARGMPHEPVPDHGVIVLGHQLTAMIETMRERTETRFAEIEAARLAAAERNREQQESLVALRAGQEDQRQRLERLTETLEIAIANRTVTETIMGLEARIETRLADIAADRDAQARRAADTYDRVLTLLAAYEPLRERVAVLPEMVTATMESRVEDILARMGARVEERLGQLESMLDSRFAAFAHESEQARESITRLRHDQDQTKLRLAELTQAVSAEAQALEAAAGAVLESEPYPPPKPKHGPSRK